MNNKNRAIARFDGQTIALTINLSQLRYTNIIALCTFVWQPKIKWRYIFMTFFRKKKELKDKLQSIDKEFKSRTAEVSDDIWDLGDFLMLLNIAEYSKPLGKSKAIVYALKIGYLAGRGGVNHE